MNNWEKQGGRGRRGEGETDAEAAVRAHACVQVCARLVARMATASSQPRQKKKPSALLAASGGGDKGDKARVAIKL